MLTVHINLLAMANTNNDSPTHKMKNVDYLRGIKIQHFSQPYFIRKVNSLR